MPEYNRLDKALPPWFGLTVAAVLLLWLVEDLTKGEGAILRTDFLPDLVLEGSCLCAARI